MSPCLVVLTDFFAVSNRALSCAAGLAMPLKAHLLLRPLHGSREVVRITDDEHERPTASALLETVTRNYLVADTPDAPLHLHERHHARVASGVLTEAAQQAADMLVVARHHSFRSGLFHRSVTAQLIQESPIPVLVLPAGN
ncbi:nucleotide-binding universal stress UspA family protein [Hymenobacter sp. UYAg731]